MVYTHQVDIVRSNEIDDLPVVGILYTLYNFRWTFFATMRSLHP